MNKDLRVSNVFQRIYEAFFNDLFNLIINQGGTRSGKTYSILQFIIFVICFMFTGWTISIVRKERSSMEGTVMRDFYEILSEHNLYNPNNHNVSKATYILRGNLIEFLGCDDSKTKKRRGGKRNLLYINEANELTEEDFFQLNIRNTGKTIIDYNPSDEFHWIYEKLIPLLKSCFIKSTYLDNYEFLPASLIEKIEELKAKDPVYWKVYGLGEVGSKQEKVYHNWEIVRDAKDFPTEFKETVYGLDFGLNHPMALVEINYHDNGVYLRELFYESGYITSDLIKKLPDLVPNKNNYVYADNAEPDRIEEIKRSGYNVHPAQKDVEAGIDYVKSLKLYIHPDSVNLKKEFKMYKWKQDKDGKILDEPLKTWDDLMDAVRYGLYTHSKKTESLIELW